MFLIEADYALKYVETDATFPLADRGLTDAALAHQKQYTKDIVTDSKGVLKGVSWQGCPGVLIYSRDVAKEVLGSDDPAEVQKAVADWDTFTATAETMKKAGYFMTSSANDTYRVYSNNVSGKWVQDGKIVVDDNIMKWVEDSKGWMTRCSWLTLMKPILTFCGLMTGAKASIPMARYSATLDPLGS